MAERLRSALDILILSYARIFFSESRILGLFVIAATMVIPSHGFFGLLGALFSNGAAYVLGLDRQSIKKGYFGFNGVLTGLGLGFFYTMSIELIFILFVTSVVLTFVTALFNNIFWNYLGIPAMSMPFNVVTWMVIFANIGFGYLHPSYDRWAVLKISLAYLPAWANSYFASFGAVLFQVNTLSGIIIAAGILIYSRIAFILMTVGFAFALWMHRFLGVDPSLITTKYLGFNYMLSALAIGGVFTVPGLGSFMLGLVTVALSVLVLISTYTLFPDYLSPLALPFNVAVMLVLYSLRSRLYPSMGVHLVNGEIGSPEENLSRFRTDMKQWRRWGMSISLPFHGGWIVSQGVNGKYTHKDNWSFAYDFQAVGADGNLFRNSGSNIDDYYGYGLPVIAPGNGKVYAVKNNVHDNLIGKINSIDNWGNYVIIEHFQNFYSCIAHFKEGSIKVNPGQDIKKGEVIGLCGNSGRSPYPHIHFQFQYLPDIGSATIFFEFSNVIISDQSKNAFFPKGILNEKSVVQNMPYRHDFENFFPYSMNTEWSYLFKNAEGVEMEELWRIDTDFYGNTFLVSTPGDTKLYFQLSEGLLSIKKMEGSRDSGLFMFGTVLSEVPFLASNIQADWTSFDEGDYIMKPLYAGFVDIFSIAGLGLKQKIDCDIKPSDDEILLSTRGTLYLKTPMKDFYLKEMTSSQITFKRNTGVASVRIGDKYLLFQHAKAS